MEKYNRLERAAREAGELQVLINKIRRQRAQGRSGMAELCQAFELHRGIGVELALWHNEELDGAGHGSKATS